MTLYPSKIQNTIRPDRQEWTDALSEGDAGELYVVSILTKIGVAATRVNEQNADLAILPGKIEVKTDHLCIRSGRVAVETSYHGRPSGITTTEAATWAFVLGATGEVVLIRTDTLRSAIAPIGAVKGGENAIIKLLPVTELRRLGVSVGGMQL
jgi:hypothetical protein